MGCVMKVIFTDSWARKYLLFSLLAVLVLLVATPVRSTVVIAVLMLYSLFYLYLNKKSGNNNNLDVWSWLVIIILSSYTVGRFGPFVISGFSGRYVSAGLHVAASIPIFLML